MSLFSQSLLFGENTLQELEKGAQSVVKVLTPNRSSGVINSDLEIIEESPTNQTSIYSFRERRQHKTSKKRKTKSRSSEQLTGTSKSSDSSKGTLSQFFRSEYDFGDEILKTLPGNSNIPNGNTVTTNEEAAENTESGNCFESDMFSQWIVPIFPPNVRPPQPSIESKANDQHDNWADSYDFDNVDLNFADGIEVNKANGLIHIAEEIALGLDNVTFTQNLSSDQNGEEGVNGTKCMDKEGESDNDLFTEEMLAECLELSILRRPDEPNFTLNYSDSTVDEEENRQQTENVNGNSELSSLSHQNSIDCWSLPASIVRAYKKKNIYSMFDWQRECLSNPKVLFQNSNLVYCAPTSAGKTLVSEILMIKAVLEKRKKALVILPFVAVVREKMNYLQSLLTSSGIQVEGYFGGFSARSFDTVDVAVCTIEKANTIINKCLEKNTIDSIGCIVMDEVHLISDPSRGYIMELLLAKILYIDRKSQYNIQIIAMSATLPNLELLTGWLRAEFYRTDYRPVALTEMIKINNQIFDSKMQLLRTLSTEDYKGFPSDIDNIGQICVETIVDGGSVIVFCQSRDGCESLAKHLATFILHIRKSQTDLGGKIRDQIKAELIDETKAQLRHCPAGLDRMLEIMLSNGCSFHHAGLTSDERDIVESSFKAGSIRIIVSTSTLSSGVNLPARRVIIRSPIAFRRMLDPLTYQQMIGRAGRTGRDTVGESILMCDSANKKTGQDLIAAKLNPLGSCLGVQNFEHLKRAILEINASGMATTKADLETFCQCTLFSLEHQNQYKGKILERDLMTNIASQDEDGISDPIGISLRFLLRKDFLRLQWDDSSNQNNFIATRFGYACLAASLAPDTVTLQLRDELQKSRESFVVETDLHAIYLVTPVRMSNGIENIDWIHFLDVWEKLPMASRRVGELVGVKESFLVRAVRGSKLDSTAMKIHKRFWLALALEELVNEKSVNDVASKFKFGRGHLQSLQQNASTWAGILTSFCKELNWTMLAKIIDGFNERLFFGVHHDLVDLMKIPDLNSRRARVLYDKGIRTLSDLANTELLTIEKILYDSICFDTKQRQGESKWDADQRNKLRHVFVTGNTGMTIREAADDLIRKARQCLEQSMGVENIEWSKTSTISSQNKIPSAGIILRIQSETTDRDRISSQQSQMLRKRKFDDDADSPGPRSGKKFRASPSDTESDSDSESEMNSAESNATEEDQSELIGKLIEFEHFNEINKINVFQNLHFFKVFESIIKSHSVVSVSVGVNQLLQRAPIIGLSSLVKQQHCDDDDISSYNCTFDGDKFIAGISLCLCDTEVYYLNFQNETNDDRAITFDMKVKFLADLFHMQQMTLVMYDAKEQCKVLLKCFPQLRTFCARLRDPLVANWLLQPEVYGNLLTMVRQFAPGCAGIGVISGVDRNRRSIALNGKSTVSPMMRCTLESFATFHVMKSQMQSLQETNRNLASVFTDIEMPIQRVLLTMELTGFPVDEHKISEVASELTATLGDLEKSMFQKHGCRFDVQSKRDKAKVLGLKATNGKISTTKQALEKLSHPIAELLLQHKTVHSTLTSIIQPFIRQVVGNRIYPKSSCFSSTGRVHLSEPSLQNVTNNFEVSTAAGPKTISCRRVFQPDPQNQLISADFCQLELRILAHFSDDYKLKEIMNTDSDVFRVIAANWNGISEVNVTDKQRNDSKQICYGIIYGMGVRSLAEKMKCDEAEAEEKQEAFLRCYSGIRIFTEKIIDQARKRKFITTITGRRRNLPDISSTIPAKRAKAERQAINSTIQGSAADIAKLAMLEMDKCVREKAKGSKWRNVNLVLHVHDELVYEAPKVFAKDVITSLKNAMENSHSLKVPLRVKVKVGHSWGAMEVVGC